MNNIHIDSFSGSVYDLTEKERRDPLKVLAVLEKDPNVSTFDMNNHRRFPLWKTIAMLLSKDYIAEVKKPYPWHRFEITIEGVRSLSA